MTVIPSLELADNGPMIRFLRATWFATTIFVGLSLLASNDGRECGPLAILAPPATALLLVPPVWRWFVMSRGRPRVRRATFAGAGLGFVIAMSGMMMTAVWFYEHRPSYTDGFGAGIGALLSLLYTGMSFLAGGSVGMCVGALIAWMQSQFSPRQPEERRVVMTEMEGAFAGGLVAILAGPIAALLLAMLLPKALLPTWSGAIEYSTFLAEVWFILVPVGALLGARAIRRWMRISASWGPVADVHSDTETSTASGSIQSRP